MRKVLGLLEKSCWELLTSRLETLPLLQVSLSDALGAALFPLTLVTS